MPTIKQFEDLEIWQDARIFNTLIFKQFANHPNFSFRDQLLRAALSIMNNIAEGFDRSSDADFRKFLDYAKASAGEVRSMLYLAFDLGYLDEETFRTLHQAANTLSARITKLMTYLKKQTPRP